MAVEISATPNPNALKFTVGQAVGGPSTFSNASETDDPMASELLAVDGVSSMFLTADFVTITKLPDADWNVIAPLTQAILEAHYS